MTSAIQQGIAGLLLYASLAHGALMAQTPQISQMAVATAEELIAATQNKKVSEINISADLADLSPLRLMPGQRCVRLQTGMLSSAFGLRQMVLRSQPTILSLVSMSVLPRLIARFGTIARWTVWGRL
jgi:hypothetical protein